MINPWLSKLQGLKTTGRPRPDWGSGHWCWTDQNLHRQPVTCGHGGHQSAGCCVCGVDTGSVLRARPRRPRATSGDPSHGCDSPALLPLRRGAFCSGHVTRDTPSLGRAGTSPRTLTGSLTSSARTPCRAGIVSIPISQMRELKFRKFSNRLNSHSECPPQTPASGHLSPQAAHRSHRDRFQTQQPCPPQTN